MVSPGRPWFFETRGGRRYLFCRPLLDVDGLRHAFSTRYDEAGIEQNLGLHVGDDPAAVVARREEFLAGLGLDLGRLVAGNQVHGINVAPVGAAQCGAGAADHGRALPDADGLATGTPGPVLSIYYADCVPLLLVDPAARAAAAVHAGWRGAAAGIAGRALAVMADRLAAEPRRVLAAVGPAIGPCCYRVGPELADHVPGEARGEVLARGDDGGLRLDLPGLVAWWLRRGGLAEDRIFLSRQCTSCHPDLYFSHRRQGGRAGRMMALVALEPVAGFIPGA